MTPENWKILLKKLSPHGHDAIIDMIANHANDKFKEFGIDGMREQACIIAHACVETAGFTTLEENLNYSAERLMKVWPKRFPTLEIAKQFEDNPVALANKVYGGRMGNDQPNDGWTFRGQGLWQSTGRFNAHRIAEFLNISDEQAANWLINQDHALECTCALYHILKVEAAAKAGDVKAQTKRINGGYNGLEEREIAFNKTIKLLTKAYRENPLPPQQEKLNTVASLREEGSRTIKGADKAQTGTIGLITTAGTAFTTVANTSDSVKSTVDSATNAVSSVNGFLGWCELHWPILLLFSCILFMVFFAYMIWENANRIKNARVEDANDGFNIGRISWLG